MESLMALITGLGLSTAAGLNAYLPLLTVGILARLGWISLAGPFDLLTHPLVLLIVAALAVLDFIGDKVPAVDSGLHAAGMLISPIAGLVLALAANSDVASVHPVVVAVAGLVAAGATHAARSAVRPAVTAATAGTGNPVVSLAEDGASLLLSLLAVLVPVLAIILAGVLALIVFRFFKGALGVWKRRDAEVYVNGKR